MCQLDSSNTADRLSLNPALVQMGGIPKFQKVSDDLYRRAQPTAQGLRDLKGLGLKTVVSLRSFHPNAQEIRNIGLDYEQIWIKSWYPNEGQVIKFLRLVTDNRKTPVLVHCHYGAARTGSMCAVYRIAVQGWTKERALEEMINGAFGFHRLWGYLIRWWVNELDIHKIRKEAGIQKAQQPAIEP